MKQKTAKGDYGYYNRKRKQVIFLTILYFGISIALYIIGYATTKSNKNLLTVFAVLGMLPASKSAVSMIMYLRYHGCSREDYQLLHQAVEPFLHAYGLVLTTYKKNYEVAACIVKNGYVYAYLSNHTDAEQELQKHISDMAKQNGYKAAVFVFTKSNDFMKRLNELAGKEDDNRANDEGLLTLLHQLSL